LVVKTFLFKLNVRIQFRIEGNLFDNRRYSSSIRGMPRVKDRIVRVFLILLHGASRNRFCLNCSIGLIELQRRCLLLPHLILLPTRPWPRRKLSSQRSQVICGADREERQICHAALLNRDTRAMPDTSQIGLELGVRCLDGKPVAGAKMIDFAVLDELVWPADADNRDAEPELAQSFDHR